MCVSLFFVSVGFNVSLIVDDIVDSVCQLLWWQSESLQNTNSILKSHCSYSYIVIQPLFP